MRKLPYPYKNVFCPVIQHKPQIEYNDGASQGYGPVLARQGPQQGSWQGDRLCSHPNLSHHVIRPALFLFPLDQGF